MNQGESPIVALQPEDLPRLQALLRNEDLPTDDCTAQLHHFIGIRDGARLIAAAALEPAGELGLLRSLVVDPDYRGQGLGERLVGQLLARARAQGMEAVYLLTETADAYFPRLGFEPVARAAAPAAIAATRQFASLCPDSARCLRLRLRSR